MDPSTSRSYRRTVNGRLIGASGTSCRDGNTLAARRRRYEFLDREHEWWRDNETAGAADRCLADGLELVGPENV